MPELVLLTIGGLATATARRLIQALGGCCLALALVAGAASSTQAAPGYPDQSFGRHGVVRLALEPTGDVVGADVAGDRRRGFAVVTRSAEDHSVLVRLEPDGSVDTGFGEAGAVSLPGGPWNAVAMAANGAIVVAGTKDGDLAVARYTPDGHLDSTFAGGEATLQVQTLPIDPYFKAFTDARETFVDVAIEPDGRILAVGNLRLYEEEVGEEERSYVGAGTVAARFRPDGNLDTSFGDGGSVNPTSTSGKRVITLNRLTLQPDGKVLLAGNSRGNLAVARLTGSGPLDPGFGSGGAIVSRADTFHSGEGFGHAGDATDVLVRPDGRLIVVGGKILLGLRPDGSRDQDFGNHGRVFTEDIYGKRVNPTASALDGKGRILIAGYSSYASSVARFLPDGQSDRRFGGDGMAVTDVTHGSYKDHETDESATAILIAPGGATVTAGFAFADSHGELAVIARAGGDGKTLYCHGKPATMTGTPGPDHIHGYGVIVAMGGKDEIRSSGGPICAGPGDDVIYNQHGDIYAGSGNDQVREDWSGTIHGGPGDDVLEPHSDSINVLYGDSGSDRLVGKGGRDHLFGGPGADVLLGGGGADWLLGGSGGDLLLGGSGTDRLVGGPGSNRLRGGANGPPKAIYVGREPGFRIRLRVEGHLIAGIHLVAQYVCRNGHRGSTSYDSNHVNLKIDPNGRFREQDYNDYGIGYSESLLAGTVHANRITGVYREFDREQVACTTGSPKHPLIHFTAKRR